MKHLFTLFLLLSTVQFSFSQTQTPAEFLGYELGERFTNHHRVVDYFKHIAGENANVKLVNYGETYEHRPLYLGFISSQKNMDNLDQIQKNHLGATGLADSSGENDIAIVWLSYNVHGNESVSTEAAIKTLYALVDKDNPNTQKWLENTLVIIDPCINPDGRERYVNWHNQYKNTPYNPNPDAREHHEPWPGGRTNHYMFDLNRDWAWATQKETQQRLEHYNNWMPHIHVDFHEQGVDNPYYFAPAAKPYHEVITPFQREFQQVIGKNHAKYFDENGWLYFTKEIFDLLYPSYGDTYPTYNGAIGMTYEQGGSGRAGLGIINAEGNELTLTDRIEHHYTTGLSTVEVASENSGKLIAEFKKYFNTAVNNPKTEYKNYIISKDNNKDIVDQLMALLDRHQIKYYRAANNNRYKAFDYSNGKTGNTSFSDTDLVIHAKQPKANFIKALFEPQTVVTDSLTYDITAWAIPYSYGLKAYATASEMAVKPYEKKVDNEYVTGVDKPYAYLAKWNNIRDAAFLGDLLQHNVKLRFGTKPFVLNGKNYPAGTLIITRVGNNKLEKDFDRLVTDLAVKHKRHLTGVATGLVESGADFGSSSVRFVQKPKIAVLSGDGVSSYNFGEIWHYFEQQIGYPVTVIDTDYFNRINLHNYNVLILPSGRYTTVFDEDGLSRLKDWIGSGGKVIAMDSALQLFAKNEDFDLSFYADDEEKESTEKAEKAQKAALELLPNDQLERESIKNLITGSIFRINLDDTHPLAFGYGKRYFTLRLDNYHYAYLKDGANVGITKDKSELVSGFAGSNALENMETSLVFGVEQKGRGNIVYLADNPLFRAFWESGKLLFANAVFFVGQ